MARGILSEYGPDASKPQAARATKGGCTDARDVMNYRPPQGPTNIGDPKSPGIHGTNYGNCGTQGPKAFQSEGSGSVGLGGKNKGMGTNRG